MAAQRVAMEGKCLSRGWPSWCHVICCAGAWQSVLEIANDYCWPRWIGANGASRPVEILRSLEDAIYGRERALRPHIL
eukprot:scaffold24117_cov31-Tisochrysis_lutea.AAC.7